MRLHSSESKQVLSHKNKGLNFLLFAVALLTIALQFGCSGATEAAANGNSVAAPSFGANASAINFGNVAIGDTKTVALTFTNTTSSAVTVMNTTVSGPGFNANGIPSGTILNTDQSATLNVSFAPSGTGGETGTTIVTSNAQNSNIVISLQGTGVPAGDHLATVGWNASQSVVTGYNVYRSTTNGGPYTRLNTTQDTGLTYTDTAVTAGKTYYYVVTAVGSGNVESAYSNQVTATIPTP